MFRNERGGSLVGTLVALAIIGTALSIMVGALFTSGSGVVVVNRQVGAQSLARQQMELIKGEAYSPDPTAVPYPSITNAGGFTTTVAVAYWDGTDFVAGPAVTDSGLQRITVAVYAKSDASHPALSLQDLKRR